MAEEAKWYVVHTYSGYENAVAAAVMKAAENRKMTDLIREVSIPMETVTEYTDNGDGTVTTNMMANASILDLGGEFRLAGETVKLVKGDDGSLTAIVGKGALATKVKLGADADTFIARLLGRVVADMDTLGAPAVKNILSAVYDRDLEGGLVASEKSSLTRQLSALILANKSGGKVAMDALLNGNYNTGILVEMAERAIDGEDIGDSKAKLDAYHKKLESDNAGLPEEMKLMLEKVANIPLEKPNAGDGEFVVNAPIVNDINNVVKAMPPPAPGPIATVSRDIGGIDGIKDFVANLVFSDDTMVGDVTVNKPGEAMRKILTEDKNVIALAEIIKNPAILDTACAPQIADAVKDGLGKMVDILDAAFKNANNGTTVQTAHLVGVGTRNEQFLSFGKGQDVAFVLQQHHAFYGSVECQLRKLLATELRIVLESLGRMLVESQSLLHAKNTADSIVDTAHGYLAFLHQLFQQDAGIHAVRFHNHIDTCINGYAQSVFLVLSHSFAGIEIVDVGPVGNEHSVPSRLLFQPYGQQLMVGMNGHSVDGSRVDHDGSCPLTDSCKERSEVLLTQVGRGDIGWGAVFARPGHTIAKIVLQRYCHMLLVNMLGVVALET